MTFASFGLGPLLVGAMLIAGLLALLQRLRVQRQVVRVATTMFWRAAAQAAPARVLLERFRHWLAFLLILAIALTLWFAGARPSLIPAAGSHLELFYLDASAGMTAGDRFAEARRALIADAGAVPAQRRAIYLGDPYGTRLLAPGEDLALLPQRLANVRAGLFPSRFAAWAEAIRAQIDARRPITLHYYGTAAAFRAADAPAAVPRIAGYVGPPIRGNRGIVAIGAVPAASGAWDKADLVLRLAAAQGVAAGIDQLVFRRNGAPFKPGPATASQGRIALRDMPADGSLIEVAFRDRDGFPADDRVALRLPERHPIRVALIGDLPATLRAVIAADSGMRIVSPQEAEVEVRGPAVTGSTRGKPAFILQPMDVRSAAFAVTDTASRTDLNDALDQLGLGQLDATAIADSLHRPVSIESGMGPVRTVSAWQALFDSGSSFAQSRTMPLFVARTLRWLASPQPWLPYAAAGGTLVDLDGAGATGSAALAGRTPGGAIALPQAEDRGIAGLPVATSLTDIETTRGAGDILADTASAPAASGPALDLPFTLALVAAALLLAVEWILFQRGRLP
ncbi:hypothetical protein [Sphingomonas pituitosa]|uniref:hypothetical protein n=1 Tax=Sphingomonas pituitosa TaxID=99597 RepID=UPI000836B2F2|nr:hypothetical protein [Sphingomonas pituitosa]